jgi:hypothetical protein
MYGAGPNDSIVISEIMYHPAHALNTPENLKQEWIELFNRSTQAVNLAGWRFSDGVEFVFPTVSIGAGKYLVVAADVSTFKAKYPNVISVVGGWTGWLSNSGEKIELVDAAGEVVDSVKYADEGDWAVRELGPAQSGNDGTRHRGWQWSDAHDGGGKSLELISAAMPNEFAPNWAASLVDGGTPGGPGIVPVTDIAPLILDVGQWPIIPGPGDAVTVTARVIDEQTTGITVTLRYRLDSSTYTNQNTYPQFNAASYLAVPMLDDGLHGDKKAGDGVFGGRIPAQANGKIVEFYVEARDAGGKVRTWPAPSLIDGVPQQVTNALYQVDGSFQPTWTPGSFPIYYIIMTEMERGRLAYIGMHSSLSSPNSQMNATFISVDGTGMELRYNVGVRNRGHGTRNGPPNNQHVAFPSDRVWHSRSGLSFNVRNTPNQIMGSAIFRMAGIVAPQTVPVQLRVNGANLATANMYGVYARLDAFDGFFADQYFCDGADGNLYACFRDNGEADLRYLGTNPNSYRPSYFKESNASADDWSDLVHLVDVLNNAPEATYLQDVSKVINVSQWLRYIALDSLLRNNETGLNLGIGDDYFMYRGVTDPRFVLIPHDLDTILDSGGNVNASIFSIVRGGGSYNGVDGLKRFFNQPEVIALYQQAMLDLLNDFFNPETLDPLIDRVVGGFAPASRISGMKQSVRQRIAAVRAQIPQNLAINSTLPVVNGYPRTTIADYAISGTANAAETRSVAINGQPGTWSAETGMWQSGAAFGPADSLVSAGSDWKYLDDGSNQGTAWYSPGFDDSAWRSGRAELGYGDGGEATLVNGGPASSHYITTYFRKSFTASKVAWYFGLRLRLLSDDGAVVYLNGVEVCRNGMPTGTIGYTTPAAVNLGGADESAFVGYDLSPAFLRDGVNTLAVEVHQSSATSSDISFDLALEATKRGTQEASLLPGINRIVVQSFDSRAGAGHKLEEDYIDIWYDTGSMSDLSGTVASDRVLDAASGPWRVTGTVTIPASTTLTIEPGTTLFFNPNARFTVNGRLLAEGTPYQSITLTRVPGSTTGWAGLQFLNAPQESRLVYVNMEYGDAGAAAIRADHAELHLDHVVWANHIKPYLVFDNSSIVLKNSVLPGIPNGEMVHFAGLPPGGHALFEGNSFGSTTGYADIAGFLDRPVSSTASISGEPLPVTWSTVATLSVGGPGIEAYKYRVNNGLWSAEVPGPQADPAADAEPLPPIVLTGLQNGQSYTVYVVGKDSAGVWQSEDSPTVSRTWTVDAAARQVVINEVLAANKSVLKHDNGFPDAVELYYDGPASMSLAGMSLTDDPQEPRKFVFGAGVTMTPGKYLVLYAADGGTASDPHLGFAFDTDGDGIYLYDKAGVLVDSVQFGMQAPDLSIGRIGSLGEWRLTVPTLGKANVARSLGDPRAVRINEWLASSEVLLNSDFVELYNPDADPVDVGDMVLTDSPALQPCRRKLGPLSFIAGHGYSVLWADDSNEPGHLGFRLSADGGIIGLFDGQAKAIDKVIYRPQTTDFSEGRAPDGSASFAILPLPTPGVANPQVQKATSNTVVLVQENAAKRVLVPTAAINTAWRTDPAFNDSTWLSGSGGVGYERSSGYETLFTINVQTQMYGRAASCYIRIPFTVGADTLQGLTSLVLKVRYDDGFVAYLNGTEVQRALFTGTPAWNSAASTRSDAEAVDQQAFDISSRLGLLHAGTNLLAIHAMNDEATSSDFLNSVALEGVSAKAAGGSAQDEDLKLLDGLRITELMYRAPKGSNYDYVELQNVIDEAIDVTGVRFDKGITFTFPALTLQPGECVVVVANQSAFRSVYGATPKVAGQYQGNLSDSGEKIVLLLPSLDVAILRFDYSNTWYPATDGGGKSLTIQDPAAAPVTWNDAESWRASDPTPGRP